MNVFSLLRELELEGRGWVVMYDMHVLDRVIDWHGFRSIESVVS